jgi:hypothetical protein
VDQRTRRIYEARRAGFVARIADSGIPLETVSRLFDAWEDDAYGRGIGLLSPAFWGEAEGWIGDEYERRRLRPAIVEASITADSAPRSNGDDADR